MKDTHLEVWAEWNEWITRGVYGPCDQQRMEQAEAELHAQGYKTRRMTY